MSWERTALSNYACYLKKQTDALVYHVVLWFSSLSCIQLSYTLTPTHTHLEEGEGAQRFVLFYEHGGHWE